MKMQDMKVRKNEYLGFRNTRDQIIILIVFLLLGFYAIIK